MEGCAPEIVAMNNYLTDKKTKEMLGVPEFVEWVAVNKTVYYRFFAEGDLYVVLLNPSAFRLLH